MQGFIASRPALVQIDSFVELDSIAPVVGLSLDVGLHGLLEEHDEVGNACTVDDHVEIRVQADGSKLERRGNLLGQGGAPAGHRRLGDKSLTRLQSD